MLRSLFDQVSGRTVRRTAAAAALATMAYAAQNYVQSDQFGLRETLGNITSGILPPRVYLHVPFFQYTHSYQANTQRIEFNAGSCRFWRGCDNTADHNAMVAHVVLNYRTEQNVDKLALHRWSMDGWMMPDGYWLLTDLMNDSANAVMGKRSIDQTMGDPKRFVAELAEDTALRFAQSNVPVEIESIEFKGFKATFPTRTVANNIVQLRPSVDTAPR